LLCCVRNAFPDAATVFLPNSDDRDRQAWELLPKNLPDVDECKAVLKLSEQALKKREKEDVARVWFQKKCFRSEVESATFRGAYGVMAALDRMQGQPAAAREARRRSRLVGADVARNGTRPLDACP